MSSVPRSSAPRVVRSTPLGVVDPLERVTVAIYELEEALAHRDTARIAVAGGERGTKGGEVHLDVYAATDPATARGTVVFVGGMSNHALGYAGFEWKLSRRGWNVVALDLRGHGRSSGRRGDFDIATMLADVRAAAGYASERFGGRLAVMGTSLGGYYALVAANAIEKFECAVSHWIFLPDQPMTPKDARLRPLALLLNRVTPGLRLPTKAMANWDAVNEDPALRQRCYDDPLMVWRYSVRGVASGMSYEPARPLTDLRVPHLVVIGERDEMTPAEYTRGIYKQLRGEKEWRSIPDAGHMGGLVEHQEEMLAIVDEFLGRRLGGVTPVQGSSG